MSVKEDINLINFVTAPLCPRVFVQTKCRYDLSWIIFKVSSITNCSNQGVKKPGSAGAGHPRSEEMSREL